MNCEGFFLFAGLIASRQTDRPRLVFILSSLFELLRGVCVCVTRGSEKEGMAIKSWGMLVWLVCLMLGYANDIMGQRPGAKQLDRGLFDRAKE